MMGAKQLVRIIDGAKKDTDERVKCLRLQAFAWRQLCMIALHDQAEAKRRAGWLMMQSVPYVNGPEVERFVTETAAYAEECGIKSGVLSPRRK